MILANRRRDIDGSLAQNQLAIEILCVKELLNRLLHDHGVKVLAGEHVQIHGVVLFHKVSRDVRGFDELHHRVALLVPRPEHDYLGVTERHHVNALHQRTSKAINNLRTTDHLRRTTRCVENKVLTPSAKTLHWLYSYLT